jgi:hypothetical protein
MSAREAQDRAEALHTTVNASVGFVIGAASRLWFPEAQAASRRGRTQRRHKETDRLDIGRVGGSETNRPGRPGQSQGCGGLDRAGRSLSSASTGVSVR